MVTEMSLIPLSCRGCRISGKSRASLMPAFLVLMMFLSFLSSAGCARKGQEGDAMKECTSLALTFTQALAARDYQKAHNMLAHSLKGTLTVEELGKKFEAIVPRDWKTVGPMEVGGTMTTWPDKKGADRGWVYVSIGGDTYSEGITVIVADEGGALRIREIEFGRP